MASESSWLSISDLGRLYGISTHHCGRALQQYGWRDEFGQPTPGALEAGAANSSSLDCSWQAPLWNADVCKSRLEQTGYELISRTTQVEQWTDLLDALEEGSPSINVTPEQMAEELPNELVTDVNNQLEKRGCSFRVPELVG